MSKMPRYEVRYDANEGWIEISDLEFMDELYKLCRRVTPVIKEMINGREFRTQEAVYRLKWQHKNRQMTEIDPNHASTI
ncbi:MAG: hypothetical protein PVH43_10690 [Desulfobacterales bacterium]